MFGAKMPSSLPTDDADTKAVKDFGIGTYDALLDSGSHGEDDEDGPSGAALPDGGAAEGPFLDFWLSYPQEETLQGKHASGMVPGDAERPPRSPRPADDVLDDVLSTSGEPITSDETREAESELPSGHWPSARADYYDTTTSSDIWAPEDSGAYVSGEGDGSELPGAVDNEYSMDDFLGSLGNFWSGFTIEDQNVPEGFPSDDLSENSAYPGNDGGSGGSVLANSDASNAPQHLGETMSRSATNLELVGSLTKDFLKAYGKKNLVRRHVLAFLQDQSLPQYLASDIVRCLKHRHSITIPDVMDTFPVAKVASSGRTNFAAMRDHFIELEHQNIRDPEVASRFRRCAAHLAHVIVGLEKFSEPR